MDTFHESTIYDSFIPIQMLFITWNYDLGTLMSHQESNYLYYATNCFCFFGFFLGHATDVMTYMRHYYTLTLSY